MLQHGVKRSKTLWQRFYEAIHKDKLPVGGYKLVGEVTTAITRFGGPKGMQLTIRVGKLSGQVNTWMPPAAIFIPEIQAVINGLTCVQSWQISRFRGADNHYVYYLEGLVVKTDEGSGVVAIELTDSMFVEAEVHNVAEEARDFFTRFDIQR